MMKAMFLKNKFAGYLALGSVILSAGACTKKLDSNAQNPNAITTNVIAGKDVFPSAIQNTVYNVNSTNVTSPTPTTSGISTLTQQWMGAWARTTSYSASGTQYQIETFVLNNTFGDNFWGSMYHNMGDYNFVISKSVDGSILPGASAVMKALVFQNLVDIFGDIPYSQALIPTITKPAYDKATAIYANLPLQLDSAMLLINASKSTSDDAADIMFKGNKAKWLAFANTVKLRILLRQIPNAATAASLQAEMNKTISYGFIGAGADATINPGYKDAANQQSPFWAVFGFQVGSTNPYQSNTFYIANQTMIDYLKATSDPRLSYLYTTASNGSYGGNYLGDAGKPVAQISSIGTGILQSPSMPGVVMTASNALFLQAEAAQRGLISGDYVALFGQAVAEDFRFLGVPNAAAAAASYISNSTDPRVNPSANPLEAIIYQKWIANAEIDGLEMWCDYRKTAYPDRTKPSTNPAASTNVIPKRLLYPQTETSQNPGNYAAQNQQSSDIYTKIFWGL
jgi:hypothetical protein